MTVTWDADVRWDVSAAGAAERWAAIKLVLDVGGVVKRTGMASEGTTGTARFLAFRYEVAPRDLGVCAAERQMRQL